MFETNRETRQEEKEDEKRTEVGRVQVLQCPGECVSAYVPFFFS